MKSNKAVIKVMQAEPKEPKEKSMAPLVEEILVALGEDPKRDGLLRTPERVDKALKFLTSGYTKDIQTILNGALYEVKYDESIVVKDIWFFCMMLVGVEKQRRGAMSAAMLGPFRARKETRDEFLALVNHKSE